MKHVQTFLSLGLGFFAGALISSLVYPIFVTQPNRRTLSDPSGELASSYQDMHGRPIIGLKYTYVDSYLVTFPSEFYESASLSSTLKILELENQSINDVPKEISRLSLLQTLIIQDSDLKNVPSQIGDLAAMKNLQLCGNTLTIIPPDIGKLAKLETLTLCDNFLENVPHEIGNLTSLRVLDLHNNSLHSLPETVKNLSGLEYLFLGGNQLSSEEKEKIRNVLPKTQIFF